MEDTQCFWTSSETTPHYRARGVNTKAAASHCVVWCTQCIVLLCGYLSVRVVVNSFGAASLSFLPSPPPFLPPSFPLHLLPSLALFLPLYIPPSLPLLLPPSLSPSFPPSLRNCLPTPLERSSVMLSTPSTTLLSTSQLRWATLKQ